MDTMFLCLSSLDFNPIVDTITPSLVASKSDLPLVSLSEFLNTSFFQDVVLTFDEDLLESMVNIDAPIVDLVFPRVVVPHQKASFTFPTQLDPISSFLLDEHFPISRHGPTQVQKKSWKNKQSLGGISLAFRHHVGFKPLSSPSHDRGKVPNYGHHVEKK